MVDDFLRALRDVLGDSGVLTSDDIPQRASHDWAGLDPVQPRAVLQPRDTAEVSRALAICHRYRVAVVPQGGLTGLAGGAHPLAGAVVLSTERLAGIEEIDPVTATATVGAGTTLAQVQAAAEQQGMMFPLDLGARGSCTIGGNLATNAGGNRVIRFGMARDLVVSLEAVLADGSIVGDLKKMLKNNTGYDLRHLLIGSEGTLGVITRAVLRLQPKPLTRQVALCGLADFGSALQLLQEVRRALGPMLSSFEVMWPSFYDFMLDRLPNLPRPLAGEHGVYVLLEAIGFDPGTDQERFELVLGELLERGILADAALAKSEREALEFWAVRDSVSEYSRVIGPIVSFDISFAISALQEAVSSIEAGLKARWPTIYALFYGHIGDGNLHVVTHVPAAAMQPDKEISKVVYDVVRTFGGSVSAEHGVGTVKKPYLPITRSTADIDVMRRLKAALDPDGLLNPGKIFDL